MQLTNPFLADSFHIPWSRLTADHVVPDMEKALERGTRMIQEIERIPDGEETLANTFLALEEATEQVAVPWSRVNHLDSVKDHPAMRKAHKEVLPKVSDFFSSIPLNQDLYRKLKNFHDSSAFASLEAVHSRFVTETLQDFQDSGAELNDATRNRLKQIQAALSEKTKEFSERVLDTENAWEKILDAEADLKGMPESLIEAARQDALNRGHGSEDSPKYRLSLHAPSMVPAMRFLESDAIRKELYEAYGKVGHYGEYENEPLIREILALRQEKARLLGKDLFPDWVLSRRMAQNGANALKFVEDLKDKTKTAFDRENQELMEFKARKTGEDPQPLYPWEGLFWAEKLRREQYDFDEEILRPYFPLPNVMSGLFTLVDRIFGIKVTGINNPAPETWHRDVRFYDIHDRARGQHLGSFYADWFPRDEKRSGAWMGDLLTGQLQEDGNLSPHLGLMAGNLMPPVGNKPALLTHSDVETIFHEFGHLLHHVLSEVKVRSLSGTNVAWDFVELPSQIMENWCWERESLDIFARHYETGESIPEDLFQKMKRSRNFGAARLQMRQLALAKMDLELHLHFNPDTDPDLDEFVEKALKGYLPPSRVKHRNISRAFSHIFGDPTGYASGYYSYKWAEVLDADAFTRFMGEGILNPETGMAFRKEILAKGNSEEPAVLFRNFMGRDPDPDALLKRLGLIAGS